MTTESNSNGVADVARDGRDDGSAGGTRDHRAILDEIRADIRRSEEEEAGLVRRLFEVRQRLSDLRTAIRVLDPLMGEIEFLSHCRVYQAHCCAVERILKSLDRPARNAEIVDRLLAEGHPLPAKRSARIQVVASVFAKYPHVFRSVSWGLWTLRSAVEAGVGEAGLDAGPEGGAA